MVSDQQWTILQQIGLKDPSGQRWSLIHRKENVQYLVYDDAISIKLARDVKKEQMFTGAYYRPADFENGGTYQISIKAADGDGIAVTGVMLWDGPADGISTYDYTEDEDWTQTICDCCLENPIPLGCSFCNCSLYNKTATTTAPPTNATSPPYDIVNHPDGSVVNSSIDVSLPMAQTACGIQIYSGSSPHVVTWCRTYNDTQRLMKTKMDLNFDPTMDYHDYRIIVSRQKEDEININWCISIYVDNRKLTEMCGIQPPSISTKLVLHVWNHNNYVPGIPDLFNVFPTKAYFKNLIMPPKVGWLCRYGNPFRGGTNPIIMYEAAIGSDKLAMDIEDYKEVYRPCIPCYSECSRYNCDSSCDPHRQLNVNFTLNDLDLQPYAVAENSTGHQYNKTIVYFLTVRAVLGFGLTAVASSDGFYIDLTPPVFEPDAMSHMYYDVTQGEFTPVRYQASNNTIKAIWYCYDDQSMIKNNFWAIGTTVGSEDIQPFTSVGTNLTGINSSLEGILQNNQTYYVSIRCVNGGGDMTEWRDNRGVIPLLIPPDVDEINTTVVGAEDFNHPVTPSDAMCGTDPSSIGFSFILCDDEAVTRYDICIGSSVNNDDIFPCTWVSVNMSGTVLIKDGALYLNHNKLYDLSALRRDQSNTSTNTFRMEPGRTLFMTLRACNNAFLCTNKSLGSATMMNSKAVLETSVSGEAIQMEYDIKSRRKRRSIDIADSLKVTTPDRLKPGQSIVLQPLDKGDLTTSYASDSSSQFQPYIVNPADTLDMVDRTLYKRLNTSLVSFALVPIGHLSMPGPVEITFYNSVTDNDKQLMLTHWNSELQQWQLTSKTCGDQNGTEIFNPDGTITVMVCSTAVESTVEQTGKRRRRSTTNSNYLKTETQFSLSSVSTVVYNTPPRLTSPTSITMEEDEGTLQYMLESVDDEGDAILFYLENNTYSMSEPSLTEDGLLLYTPCKDCSGTEYINIILTENQTDPAIPVASIPVTLTVTVTNKNDHPVMFLTQYGESILHQDPSEPVIVYLEQMLDHNHHIWSQQFSAVIGAYDIEAGDQLSLFVSHPDNGSVSVTLEQTSTPVIKSCPQQLLMDTFPCGNFIQLLPYDETQMSWIYVTVTYIQPMDYYGYDDFKVYVKDDMNATSEITTIRFAIMESPCQNKGQCQAKNNSNYPCEDVHRAESFDQYYDCVCVTEFTGLHCEEDVDECAQSPSPCPDSCTCINKMNGFTCTCPDCGLQPWMIALIVLAAILVVACIVVLFFLRTKTKSRKFVHPTNITDTDEQQILDDSRSTESIELSDNESNKSWMTVGPQNRLN